MDRGGDEIRPFPSGSVRRYVRTENVCNLLICVGMYRDPLRVVVKLLNQYVIHHNHARRSVGKTAPQKADVLFLRFSPDMPGKELATLASPALLLTQKKLQAPPKSDILLDAEIPKPVDNTLRTWDRDLVLWLCALRPWLPSNGRFTVHKTQFIACLDGFFQDSPINRRAVLRLTLCRQVYTAAKSIFALLHNSNHLADFGLCM